MTKTSQTTPGMCRNPHSGHEEFTLTPCIEKRLAQSFVSTMFTTTSPRKISPYDFSNSVAMDVN